MSNEAPLILVGTNDVDFYLFVDHVLQSENIATHYAATAEEIELAASTELLADAILLDYRGRTDIAGESCALLKQNVNTRDIPIVALIDPGDEWRYIQLLKSGVNNIFVRPILPAKLIEGIRSTLQRSTPRNGRGEAKAVRYADVEMDLAAYRVRRNGQEVHLSPIEFKLLHYFLRHPEQVVSREELHNAAWRDNIHVGPRTVDVHVGRLRRALSLGGRKSLIRTVRSVGYAFSMQVIDQSPRN